MSLFNSFPWSHGHELNLDWIITEMRGLKEEWKEWKGINGTKWGNVWNIEQGYAPWTIVLYKDRSYISKRPVPVGVVITNTDYWQDLGALDPRIAGVVEDIEALSKTVTANENEVARQVKIGAQRFDRLEASPICAAAVGITPGDITSALADTIKNNPGKTIRIPAGTYSVTAPIIVDRVSILCDPGTYIELGPDALIEIKNKSVLDGGHYTAKGAACLKLECGPLDQRVDVRLSNLDIRGVDHVTELLQLTGSANPESLPYMGSVSFCIFENLSFSHGKAGIVMRALNGGFVNANQFSNLSLLFLDDGIKMFGASDSEVAGNLFTNVQYQPDEEGKTRLITANYRCDYNMFVNIMPWDNKDESRTTIKIDGKYNYVSGYLLYAFTNIAPKNTTVSCYADSNCLTDLTFLTGTGPVVWGWDGSKNAAYRLGVDRGTVTATKL